MGQIQGQFNQLIGTASIAAGIGKHAAAEAKQAKIAEQKNQAEIAALKEQQDANKAAYKNDTIEAAEAIRAHETEFKPDVKFKSESGEITKKAYADLTSEEKAGLNEDQINALAKEVEKFRSGKMTTDRIANMEKYGSEASKLPELEEKNREARKIADPLTQKGGRNAKYQELTGGFTRAQMNKKIKDARMANKYLKKSYESFRELNDRIATSRELKFDISAAEKKLDQLKGGNK